ARVQASVLSLYDSERLKGPMMKGEETSWDKIDSEIGSKLSGNIRILSSTIISPSTKSVIANFSAKHPGTRHVTYDAVSYHAIAKANNGVIPSYNFDKANVIVSFAADFLANWLSPVEYAWQYAQGRKLNNGKETLSKHVQFETTLSLTGSNADVRIPVKPSQIGAAAAVLYNAVASLTGGAPVSASGNMTDEQKKAIADSAKWLADNKGRSLVVCGINDEAIQTIVTGINQMLGNYGQTIDTDNHSNCHQGNDERVKNLLEEMKAGKVDALIVYNANPAYTLPGFADALQKVKTKISFAATMDETASLCDYVCPDHHYLEAWNDALPKKNSFSLAQPTITPIYNTRSAQETLMKWCGMPGDYYSHIQSTWEKLLFPASLGFTEHWNRSLHDGVSEIIPVPAEMMLGKGEKKPEKKETAKADTSAVAMVPSEMPEGKTDMIKMSAGEAASVIAKEKGGDIELFIYEKTGIGIGNQANNPWLQELPDPISKCTWDNYITMNPSDMDGKYSLLERGDYMGDIVKLSV
ncbi:MAG: molybdopterin oxidoreductase, partial [Bacteroidota bacterium]